MTPIKLIIYCFEDGVKIVGSVKRRHTFSMSLIISDSDQLPGKIRCIVLILYTYGSIYLDWKCLAWEGAAMFKGHCN